MSHHGLGYEDRPDPELHRLRDQRTKLQGQLQDIRTAQRNEAEKVRLRKEIADLQEAIAREQGATIPALPAPSPLVFPAPRLEIATLQARHEP